MLAPLRLVGIRCLSSFALAANIAGAHRPKLRDGSFCFCRKDSLGSCLAFARHLLGLMHADGLPKFCFRFANASLPRAAFEMGAARRATALKAKLLN